MASYSGIATAGNIVSLPQAMLDVYSADIMQEALAIMRYEEFAVIKTELLVSPGEVVRFTKYNNLPRGGVIAENDSPTIHNMSASQVPITVTEYINAVGVSEKLLQLSWDNLLAQMAMQLGRDYATVRDLSIRDTLVAGGQTLFTNPLATSIGQVGANDKFDIEVIRQGVELLESANAPRFYNDFYVCFVHPHQAAYLRRDPDWIAAHNYHQTRGPFSGEIGRWEDVVFISTTHQGNGVVALTAEGYEAALDGTGAGGTDLYRATLIADQAYGVADALVVEMRDDGVNNFGRLHALAWYAIWGVGILEPDFIVHMISS